MKKCHFCLSGKFELGEYTEDEVKFAREKVRGFIKKNANDSVEKTVSVTCHR